MHSRSRVADRVGSESGPRRARVGAGGNRTPGKLRDPEGVVLTATAESTDIYRGPPELPRDLVQAALLALDSGDAGLARLLLRRAPGVAYAPTPDAR